MGGVSSIPHDPNILDQIKNKEYSVISINQKPGSLNPDLDPPIERHEKVANIKVSELKNIRALDGTGKCTPLPPSVVLKPGNTINKNIFVSQTKGQHIRLYADRRCRIRANEEAYAVVNPPRDNLFYPNYTGTDTEFTFVPYQSYQNAHFYRITDQVINTPRLPQFFIKRKEDAYDVKFYKNKQFVEYVDTEPVVCREIPNDFPEDFPNLNLDYRFQARADDSNTGRETGVDRFPDEKNNRTNATKYTPITIYTDLIKDKNSNVVRDVNDNPFCTNIYTPSIINLGDKIKNGPHKYPTSNQQIRYTPIPYTGVRNYGTTISNKSNSLYYELKNETGILD